MREKQPGLLIGLTGLYCAGKNYVAGLLERRGLPVLELDKLGHEVLETEREAILSRFGPGVLGPGGLVDRKLLGAMVFGKPAELAALEGIVHPAVNRITETWIKKNGDRPCVINAALIHRSCAFPRLDCIILVKTPVLTRLLRARKRDRLPWTTLVKRFRSQREFTPQYFKKNTDIYTVYNHGLSGFPAFFGGPEKQIEVILSRIGITQGS
ncbi:MAG: dephospho-CoA kinase [Spirochaetaceae bacterium]|nr:dephospho-CoA kinase [Spirochaetaceae bacterium]